MTLPIHLEKQSTLPLYLQIAKAIKEKIKSGLLKEDTRLPSSKALAEELGLARSTVVKAYEDLAQQGYAHAKAGGATYVSRRAAEKEEFKEYDKGLNEKTKAGLSTYARQIMSIDSRGASSVENEQLNYGSPAKEFLPLKIWKQILVQESNSLSLSTEFLQPEPFGLYSCRRAISEFLCRSKGLECGPEQVVLFSGCKEPLLLTSKLLLNQGDLVALEDPCYEDARTYMQLAGARTVEIPADDNGFCVENLVFQAENFKPESFKLVYVSALQDPTGVILSMERRQALIDWTQKNGSYIFEEAWDTDFNYLAMSLPALQSLAAQNPGAENNVLFSYCFWKLLYPLVSLGVLVIPRSLIEIFSKYREISDVQFSVLEQRALSRFIDEGHLDRLIRKTKPAYERLRRSALDCLLSKLRNYIEIPKQSSALQICLRFDKRLEPEEIEEAARIAGLPLISTSPYYKAKAPQKNEYLLPFAILKEEQMIRSIENFWAVLKPDELNSEAN